MLDVNGLMLLQVNFLGLLSEVRASGRMDSPLCLTSAGLIYGQKVEQLRYFQKTYIPVPSMVLKY